MRILLVEDEDKIARSVSLGLEAENYAVDRAADGDRGLERALSVPYDLLIVDLMVPGISGIELISRFRTKNTQVPILVLAARDGMDGKVKNFEIGADDYLAKPFDFAELSVRIRVLLRRGTVNHSDVIQIGELEIDRVAQRVKRGSADIKLTAKEYALLEYLALNAGRVVSRTMIIENVWDQSFDGFTNIVDVYIRQLRVKIDDPFEQKLIHTMRNVGHSLGLDDAK